MGVSLGGGVVGTGKNQILRYFQSQRITQLSKSYGITQCSVKFAEYFHKVYSIAGVSMRRSAGQGLRRSRIYSAANNALAPH